MRQTGIRATVALDRMWLFGRQMDYCTRQHLQSELLEGYSIEYDATDSDGAVIGHTKVTPDQWPVATVTEDTR